MTNSNYEIKFSNRVTQEDFQGQFLKSILKAISSSNIISFAGGLPNPISFPVEEIETAAHKVLKENGVMALQYSSTEGYLPLREFIAARYRNQGLEASAEDILITNGSQQALDILAAVLLNEGDSIIMEKPSYLAALQTFHLYNPKVLSVNLNTDGADCTQLKQLVEEYHPKFFYSVPNFQNPTGLTYTEEVRERTAEILKQDRTIFIEDNPYGDLRFSGEGKKSMKYYLGEKCVLVGSFSKIVSPGMRIGWICTSHKELKKKITDYKQTVDLHTNIFGQMILSKYLENSNLDEHLKKITSLYKSQSDCMIACMEKYFPQNVTYTKPEGGMFLWVTLPESITAVELFEKAWEKGVAICPGDPFYQEERNVHTIRLNYTNCDDSIIEKGIRILGDILKKY